MTKLIITFTLVSLYAISAVRSELQCYVCTDCTTVKDDQIKGCDATTTTTTTTSTTTTAKPTTAPPAVTTSDPTTGDSSSGTEVTTESSSGSEPTTDSSSSSGGNEAAPTDRKKRSVLNTGCVCYDGKCDCSGRSESVFRAAKYQCYKVMKGNSTDVQERGCKLIPDGVTSTACELLGLNNTTCSYCEKDKCNSAFSIKFSIVLLISVMVMLLIE